MNDALTQQYDSLYASEAGGFGGGEPVPAMKLIQQHLPGGTVLDVGGGEGRNAIYLARQGYEVTVTDLSKVGLAKVDAVAETESLPIKTVVSDVVSDRIKENFDAVICTFVLHHINTEDATQVIGDMQTHTNKDGLNVITTFTNEGGLYERNLKSSSGRYYPTEEEIVGLYSGWEIIFKKTRETTSHAKDKNGNRMKNQMVVLVAKRT